MSFTDEHNREKSDENFRDERFLIEKKQRLGENILISQRFQMLDEELDCLSLKQNNSRNKKKR